MAMRDKEGRTLANAHLLGFLWRILKLLFYGIQPVFVFDGGAPVQKRRTLANRKQRRTHATESHARAAEKLLAAQLRQAALAHVHGPAPQHDPGLEDGTVYYDTVGRSNQPQVTGRMNDTPAAAPAPQTRKDWHKDPYQLPALQETLHSEPARKQDLRLASEGELRALMNTLAPDDLDTNSELFRSLPAELQYELVGDLRMQSRTTSYQRLQDMLNAAPTPIDFSKAQIAGLRTRNDLTQKVLTITDEIGSANIQVPLRVAGARNREYVLVHIDDGDGGYALGTRDAGTSQEKAIDVDLQEQRRAPHAPIPDDDDEDWDALGMEDVEIPATAPVPDPELDALVHLERDPMLRKERALELLGARAEHHRRQKRTESGIDAREERLYGHTVPHAPSTLFRETTHEEPIGPGRDTAQPTLPARLEEARQRKITRPAIVDELDEDELEDVCITDNNAPSSREPRPACAASPADAACAAEFVPAYDPHANLLPGPEAKAEAVGKSQSARPSSPPAPEVAHPTDRLAQAHANQPHATPAPHLPPVHDTPLPPTPTKHDSLEAGPKPQESLPPSLRHQPAPKEADRSTPPAVVRPQPVDVDVVPALKAEERVTQPPPANGAAAYTKAPPASSVRTDAAPNSTLPTPAEPAEEPFQPGSTLHASPASPPRSVRRDEASNLAQEPPASPYAPRSDAASVAHVASPTPVRSASHSPSPPPFEWSPSVSPEPPVLGSDGFFLPSADEVAHLEDREERGLAALEHDQSEFASFLSQTSGRNLRDLQNEVGAEVEALRKDRARLRRSEEDITLQMAAEVQALLRLFGLPYLTAPMEAEAQCAQLATQQLVDGIITDDSDVFLFGGSPVYRNMFNNKRMVECYLLSDIQRELSLDRDRLIELAFLLGSDYTEGLPGVGPVLAMEILSLYPGTDGLQQFRRWWQQVQIGAERDAHDARAKVRRRIKRALRDRVHLSDDWPDPRTRQAYVAPSVDTSDEPFVWGHADLDALRAFLSEYLHWPTTKTDEYLLPVIEQQRKTDRLRRVQATLDQSGFLSGRLLGERGPRPMPAYGSARLQQVVNAFRAQRSAPEANASIPVPTAAPAKRAAKRRARRARASGEEEEYVPLRTTRRRTPRASDAGRAGSLFE